MGGRPPRRVPAPRRRAVAVCRVAVGGAPCGHDGWGRGCWQGFLPPVALFSLPVGRTEGLPVGGGRLPRGGGRGAGGYDGWGRGVVRLRRSRFRHTPSHFNALSGWLAGIFAPRRAVFPASRSHPKVYRWAVAVCRVAVGGAPTATTAGEGWGGAAPAVAVPAHAVTFQRPVRVAGRDFCPRSRCFPCQSVAPEGLPVARWPSAAWRWAGRPAATPVGEEGAAGILPPVRVSQNPERVRSVIDY